MKLYGYYLLYQEGVTEYCLHKQNLKPIITNNIKNKLYIYVHIKL